MTAPTPNTPLTADDVKLLVEGDWLQHRGMAVRFARGRPTGLLSYVDENGWERSIIAADTTFLGRPADPNDPEGWIKHDGGPNPAPGIEVETVRRYRDKLKHHGGGYLSDTIVRGWEHRPEGHGGGDDIIRWRPHVPARGGEAPSDIAGAALSRDLEATERAFESPPQPKGEVEAADLIRRLKQLATADSMEVSDGDGDANVGQTARDALSALTASQEREARAVEAFAALRDNSWDLRCFNVPTGGDDCDIGWRVIGHWMAEPRERVVAEVFNDDPAEAVRQALQSLKEQRP